METPELQAAVMAAIAQLLEEEQQVLSTPPQAAAISHWKAWGRAYQTYSRYHWRTRTAFPPLPTPNNREQRKETP